MTTADEALAVADWRRRVHALYAEVREVAATSPADAHQLWRDGRDRLFGEHDASPIVDRDGFDGLPTAPYDQAWRFELPILDAEPESIEVGTGTDGNVTFSRIGRVEVPGAGSLDLWWHEGYGGGLFLPVRDGLAGARTYGGGRYLLDTAKGADLGSGATSATLVVDLNFAYNPSCAYDPAWACPLPRVGNTVETEIPAGELMPAKGWSTLAG